LQELQGSESAAAAEAFSIARQPIVDAEQAVVGYELFNRSQASNHHSLASDVSMVLHSLAQGGKILTDKRSDLFVNTTHEGLTGAHWDFLSPKRTVIEVPPVRGHAAEAIDALRPALQGLRERGFRLAFHYTVVSPQYQAWHGLADFVKVDCSKLEPAKLKPLVHAVHNRTGALSVAEKVENAAQFDELRDTGFLFFQGYWFAQPEVVQTKALNPSQVAALQLYNLLRKDDVEIGAVEAAIKRDVSLGFNLLRIINAAAFGREQKVTSIRQAVALMGLEKLQKWAAMLVTAKPGGRPTIFGTTAVVRARMMELLAEMLLPPEERERAFLIGLFSLLDRLLGCPMQEALALVAVDDPVSEALLQGGGPFADLLAMTIACESDDGDAFAQAAAKLQLTYRQINIAQMDALVWADETQG
jgi:EAL and modified HD-GYP domain-containing signal transduction protein